MVKRLALIGAYLISMLGSAGMAPQANSTSPGALAIHATITSIGVVAPYTGDDNQNSQASLRYKPSSSSTWLVGHELYADRSARQWRGSVVSLSPGVSYDMEVQFTDPDGVSPSSQSGSVSTRPDYPNVGSGGTVRYVPDSGSLQTVIDASAPGDTIRLRAGTYYTSVVLDESDSGTPGHYLTIEAEPGAHVVLDGSDPALNNSGVDNWIRYGTTNIYYTDLPWGDTSCSSSGSLPNYVGEQRDGDGVRYLLFNHGSDEWDPFLAAPPGKAYYSCDSTHTLRRLYVTTFAGDDPDNHTIHVSRYWSAMLFTGADYVRVRNLEIRYYSKYSLYLRKPIGVPDGGGSDNNIIEGNTFHGDQYGIFVGQWDNPASANNLIQDNLFYERGYKDSGWTWRTAYDYAWSGGAAIIWAQPGNVVRRNHFIGGSDGIDVQFQSHDTDVYENVVEDCLDDGIEVDEEPSYNIRVWGNTIRNCLSGISNQTWFRGNYWNVGPIYVFRNLIVGGRDPQGRSGSDGEVYTSEYAFKVGSNVNDNGIGRVYYYHNTISIPDAVQNGNGIQNAGGIYFSGIVARNNLWEVTRKVIQLALPTTVNGHSLDCDNLHNPGTSVDDNFVWWSDHYYRDLPSFQTGTGQEPHAISNNGTLFNPDYSLQSNSPEVDTGCVIAGFNDRYPWTYRGVKPDIGAFEYIPAPNLSNSAKISSAGAASKGEVVTFTIQIVNSGDALDTTAWMTDTLPAGIELAGAASATLGEVSTPTTTSIYWHGILNDTAAVSISIPVKVTTSVTSILTNSAQINDGLGTIIQRSATMIVNPLMRINLPVVWH